MAFNNLFFIFLFAPVVVALYHVVPKRAKNLFLLAASYVFYAWGDIANLPFLFLLTIMDYAIGLLLDRFHGRRNAGARLLLTFGVLLNLAFLAVFKYTSIGMPLGVSFYTFSTLSYLFDVYQGRAEGEPNFIDMALYVSFFPKVISGPIVQYGDMRERIDDRQPSWGLFCGGLTLFVSGLVKKVIFADTLSGVFGTLYAMEQPTVVSSWLTVIAYSLELYLDFSGYSDMAIGLAALFGFKFDKNFDHPYESKSMREFWKRWHISLGAWFLDYVYIPLGGNRCSKFRQFLNLMVVWVLTGIWHGATINFVFWGLYHGVLVCLEHFALKEKQREWPTWLRIIVTDLLAGIGWVFFFAPTASEALACLQHMVGIGVPLASGATLYYLQSNFLLIALAVLASSTLPRRGITRMLQARSSIFSTLVAACYVICFVICVAFMVGNTYVPFLYFKF